MSELKVTNLSHPTAGAAAITLAADGTVTLPGFGGGIGSNVATVTLATTLSLTIAGGATGVITGLTVDFTPTSAASKALVTGHVTVAHGTVGTTRNTGVVIKRDGTIVGAGDVAGLRNSGTSATFPTNALGLMGVAFSFIDSPATTSEVTYTVELSNGTDSTGFFVNRTANDTNQGANMRASSALTIIEVAA